MELLITIIHIVAALFMILVVLVQGGNQGGVGAAFGGGNTQGVFGASGAMPLLGKLTYAAAFIFMTTTLSLTIIKGGGGSMGLKEKLEKAAQLEKQQETQNNTPAPAATETPAAAEAHQEATPAASSTVQPHEAAEPATQESKH